MKRLNAIINTSIGNILEWYDFGLFSIFAALFSNLFFPSEDPKVAIVTTFSIFAVGFLCRPIGAVLFGYLGDKQGRAKTLKLSILMITLPTLLIGVLPTYQQVGVWAPILLLIARMWQGISIGGEYSGSLIYLAETAPANRRGFVTSFASMGSNIGILMAALVGVVLTSYLSQTMLANWGWRIAYLVSGMFSFMIYLMRYNLQETPVFRKMKLRKVLRANPLTQLFKDNLPQLIRTLGMLCMGCTFYYFIFTYLPNVIEASHSLSLHRITLIMTFYIVAMVLIIPVAGYVSDLIGRRKLLLFNAILVSIIVVPGFYLIQLHNIFLLFLTLTFFIFASALEQGVTTISVIENFPAVERYIGVSISYNLANGFLGGSVPLVCEWLSGANFSLAPALYILCFALITSFVIFYFVPETRWEKLY